MDQWVKVLSCHWPARKFRKSLAKVVLSFEGLSAGLKTAFTWDFFVTEQGKLQQAVTSLITEGLVEPQTTMIALQQGVGILKIC